MWLKIWDNRAHIEHKSVYKDNTAALRKERNKRDTTVRIIEFTNYITKGEGKKGNQLVYLN